MTYQQQPVFVQVQRGPSNGVAVAALVLGIVAVVVGIWAFIPILGFVAGLLGFVPAVLAVVFGHIGSGRARSTGVGHSSAVTGMVLGYLTLTVIVLSSVFSLVIMVGGRS